MATDQKCVDYAWECIRLAGLADDPEIRDRLMDMARSWLAVAERTHPVDERSHSHHDIVDAGDGDDRRSA
jgi:hypothetical protein